MEQSLAQLAKLNRDVFERAKRRAVISPCEYQMHKGGEDQEEVLEDAEGDHARLEAAFSTMAEFMVRTTEECEKYYVNKSPSSCNRNEVNHFCRYHFNSAAESLQKPVRTTKRESVPSFTVTPPVGKNLKNVNIEVRPGTYSITARAHGAEFRTQLVNITPGQSVDVMFTM